MLAMLSLLCLGLMGMAFLPDPIPDSENGSDDTVALKDSQRNEAERDSQEAFFIGTEADDVLEKGDGEQYLDGFEGDYLISGGGGSDILHGGPGSNFINGGSGDDFLIGHTGNDQLFGENGDDELVGGDCYDSLFGGPGEDSLSGYLGQDYLVGGAGEDVLFGGASHDVLDGKNDEISPERDFLNGGSGNDVLVGGMKDVMSGGTEADLFIIDITLNDGANPAQIDDFEKGVDAIEITLLPDIEPPKIEILAQGNGSALLLDGHLTLLVTNTSYLEASDISFVRSA